MLASKLLVSKFFQRSLSISSKKLTKLSQKDIMKLGTVSHVAIATPNLDKTVSFYRDVLGAKVGDTAEFPIHGVKAAYVELGNTQFELMEPTGDTSPVARFLRRNPLGGMHHVCLRVSSIAAAAKRAKEAGLRLLEDRPPFGPHGQPVIFLHPSDCGGVLFELEIQFRPELLNWLKLVCETTNLTFLTYNHAIVLLDAFMDKYDIEFSKLKPVAAVCLMLAAKLEQSGNRLPSYARMFAIDQKEHEVSPPNDMVTSIEKRVLVFFDYRLLIPTVADFLYFLLPDVIIPGDLKPEVRNTSVERSLRLEIRDHFHYLLVCINKDRSTYRIPFSWLACACYINARIKFNLLPSWPESMIELTGYWPTNIIEAIGVIFGYSRMLDEKQRQEEEQREMEESMFQDDSGYSSTISPPDSKYMMSS